MPNKERLPRPPQPEARDPEAESRLAALLKSPSYVRADLDLDWIGTPEMRGARLLIEYAKAQTAFVRHGILSTIVLFGGARIKEPDEARRLLKQARAEATATPDDSGLERAVRAAEKAVENSRYYDVARKFARIVSEEFQRRDERHFVIVTGGGPGIMEAGNRGAFEAGAKTAGLNIELPFEQIPNTYITPELCFQFRYFAIRKMHFLAAAKALVAFPGGYGTFDELFETLCLIQTHIIKPVPVILVGEEFWSNAFDAEFLAEEGVISPKDIDLFSTAETAEEIRDHIVSWYSERGVDPREGPGPYRSG